MHHSGYFDKVGTEGLVKRRGKPVEKMPAKALRRRKAAATVLEMAIMIMVQGPSLLLFLIWSAVLSVEACVCVLIDLNLRFQVCMV